MGETIKAGVLYYTRSSGKVYVLLVKPSDPNYGGSYFQIFIA
jgi:predicted NUDIX family NTP pyrophosphohydrolase